MIIDIKTDDEYISNAGFVAEEDSISELWEANGEALEQHEASDDVMWSLASNSFFVSGGLCYVVGCSWDMHGQPDDSSAKSTWMVYNALWLVGALVYLFNSIIDVLWALRVKRRQKHRRLQRQYRLSLKEKLASTPKEDQSRTRKLLKKLKPKNIWKRARKHVAHRRGLSAAISFGFAAAFGTISAVLSLSANKEATAGLFAFLSTHFYQISSLFAICGSRPKPGSSWWVFWSDADRLEELGDALFGIGAMVDVILCDMHFDDGILYWPVILSCLWLTDALFYLRSDFCTLYSQTVNYKDFDTGEGDDDISATSSSSSSTMTENNMYFHMFEFS